MSYTKRYDYRREFKDMSLPQLENRLVSLNEEWDKWFTNPFGLEQAEKVWRKIRYVKQKIEKIKQ